MGPRVAGWEAVLAAEIARAEGQSFEWGRHDCCTWVAAVVLALTGRDVGGDWRGRYRSQLGAARRLRRLGGMVALWTRHFGAPLPTPLLAQMGDVALYQGAAGIVAGRDAVFLGPTGVTRVPLRCCDMAWGI